MGKLKLVCEGCHPKTYSLEALKHYVIFLIFRWLGTEILLDV